MSSRLTLLQRAETENTTVSRLRSDSTLSGTEDEKGKILPHPVESRSRIAMLPPVLVCLLVLVESAFISSKLIYGASAEQNNRRRPVMLAGIYQGCHPDELSIGYVLPRFSVSDSIFKMKILTALNNRPHQDLGQTI